MKIENKEKETLRLAYEGGKPVMKMERDGVKMTFYFADAPSVIDVKKVIIDFSIYRKSVRVTGDYEKNVDLHICQVYFALL